MKRFTVNIILFFLPFLIGIVVLLFIPVNKKFSYNFVKGECDNKASWIYQRIFEDRRQIEVAFTGASQTSCGVMDETIENELTNRLGENINVANLGYCRRGRDIQYIMLKELFRHKKPSILIIEVAEDEPKKSHPVFPFLAESFDLLGSFIVFNQRYFSNIWKGIAVRFEHLKHQVFNTDYLTVNYTSSFGYMPSNQLATNEDFDQNKVNWQERNSKPKPAMFRNMELNYSEHYLSEIVKLANENNCKIMFLYLPESGSGIKTPLLSEFYTNLGELVILPDSIISNHLNWKDATHFNDSGAKKASYFITNKIAANY